MTSYRRCPPTSPRHRPYAGTFPPTQRPACGRDARAAGVVEEEDPGVVAHTTGRWRLVDPLLRAYLAALVP